MARKRISFVLNGAHREAEAEPTRTLLKVLRDDLDFTGAKEGCDVGECGSCTVLLDGKATLSCRLPISRVQGKEVTTIEGLAQDGKLHPVQEAFITCGALQCGFCTPGMIMQTKAFLDRNPSPSRADVVRALSRNLCRCTGYVKIIDAVLYASELMRGGKRRPEPPSGQYVGVSIPRLDGRDKVTGQARYAADLKLPGMLHAKILRSPHHHARILGIDTSEAEKLPGVVAVVTAKDVPNNIPLVEYRPQAYLFPTDRVRYRGEGVAVVAAETEEVAAQALARIKVDYEPLPAVFDPLEAMKEDAPKLFPEGNVVLVDRVEKGDLAQGFAQADVIEENTYNIPYREICTMEPYCGVAHLDEEGRVALRTVIQKAYTVGPWIAKMLGIEPDRVRFMDITQGGTFGSKGVGNYLGGILALLTFKTKRPVMLVFSREESLLTTFKVFPAVMKYRTGATREGKLTALEAVVFSNGGNNLGGNTVGLRMIVDQCTGPYRIPNVSARIYEVATNCPQGSTGRGFGSSHVAIAMDSQMERLATRLGIDPLELRLRNAVEVGYQTHIGQVLDYSVGFKDTLEVLKGPYAEAVKWAQASKDPKIKRGVGLGCAWRHYGPPYAGGVRAAVELLKNGKVRVIQGAPELGQGNTTTIAQITAQELGMPLKDIELLMGDTVLAPYPVSGGAGRPLQAGVAVQQAAHQLRQALVKAAAQALEERANDITLWNGWASSSHFPQKKVSLARLAAFLESSGLPLKYEGVFSWRDSSGAAASRYYGAYAPGETRHPTSDILTYLTDLAQVEVNVETGQVKVVRLIHAHDVGNVINPAIWEGQAEGGVMMGVGFALKERFIPGETSTLKAFGLPTTRDVPEIVVHSVGEPVPTGPFGAKGGAESSNLAAPPAIINAVANAIGVRIEDLPIAPEKVLKALSKA